MTPKVTGTEGDWSFTPLPSGSLHTQEGNEAQRQMLVEGHIQAAPQTHLHQGANTGQRDPCRHGRQAAGRGAPRFLRLQTCRPVSGRVAACGARPGARLCGQLWLQGSRRTEPFTPREPLMNQVFARPGASWAPPCTQDHRGHVHGGPGPCPGSVHPR